MFVNVKVYDWRIPEFTNERISILTEEYNISINTDYICSIRPLTTPKIDEKNKTYFTLNMVNGYHYLIDSEDYMQIQKYLNKENL